MICGGLTVNGTLTLNPGTYYFYNAPLSISGTVSGNGVTLVFTGDSTKNIGGLSIAATANVNLTAPPVTASNPPYPFPGMLFFTDNPSRANGNNPQITINGGANVVLNGGMYFRNSDVTFNGTASVNSCTILVGYSVTMSGTSTPSLTQCQSLGFQNLIPITRIVRLVE